MKHSIKKQFAMIFISLMALTILICWFVNNTFLQMFYEKNRQEALFSAYRIMNHAFATGDFESDEFNIELEKICNKYNISLILMDINANLILTNYDSNTLKRELIDNVIGINRNEAEIMKQDSNYTVQRIVEQRTNSEYIEMWGELDNGPLFLMRIAIESIRESVEIANRFLAYVGILAVMLSAFIIWMVARKITNPILELVEISERMIHLDFEAKYTGKSKTEIALLGDNINTLSETLEQTISELKTANNELQKDIEKKNRIDEMRKEFLSNVSHELKTPLALIQGYAEGLKEGIREDEESREFYCEVIMDEANKMNSMVKKLLTLNELEFGNNIVAFERFDVVDLICNYIQSAGILTKQNDISVRMEKYEPIYVWADEFKTEEVFMNYFSNAVNHAAGEKVIEIRLEKKEKTVRISVFNTGIPIPEDAIDHIWEKFYKVDKARTREYGGSGVGLSIVKAEMDSMNQKYGVVNYENGVEFWFELETVSAAETAE